MRAKGRGLHDCKGAKPCTEERKDGYLNQKEQYLSLLNKNHPDEQDNK